MIDDKYPNLNKLFNKYNLAINSNSKEIRLTTIELGLILQDITNLSIVVANHQNSNLELKVSVDILAKLLKEMISQDDSF
jgi:uncharacterized coiled-coil protein SlyX